MTELEVNCVQRAYADAPHHYLITHVGHREFACRMPVALAVVQIRGRLSRFYVLDPTTQARVYIDLRRESGKRPYLQARIDGTWTEHLLNLQECRTSFRLIREGVSAEIPRSVRFLLQR